MKKIICIVFAFLMGFALLACGTDDSQDATSSESSKEKVEVTKKENSSEGIDIDLTKLSSTMVYSEVYNMMNTPSDYMGKIVKMKGQFAVYHDEATDNYYYACVIADATACCQQGLEFVLSGDHKYPDDYPEIGSEITVVGEFSRYKEGSYEYSNLINASFQ